MNELASTVEVWAAVLDANCNWTVPALVELTAIPVILTHPVVELPQNATPKVPDTVIVSPVKFVVLVLLPCTPALNVAPTGTVMAYLTPPLPLEQNT